MGDKGQEEPPAEPEQPAPAGSDWTLPFNSKVPRPPVIQAGTR
jgi:hypothetical protein